MTQTINYVVQEYNNNQKNIFRGVYNDFKIKAYSEYKFELEPLEYEDFTESIDNGLIKCLILFEDSIPTAFIVYTTEISESIELNIIHCLGDENKNHRRKLLLEKFLEINKDLMKEKVVTYPMLGSQEEFVQEITNYGFNLVGQSVMRFNFSNSTSVNIFKNFKSQQLPNDYKITSWSDEYTEKMINIINVSFKNSSDALFDTRYSSIEGCCDILHKITDSIYGKFLPDCTSVLLYNNEPVGICFANITAGRIANIPLVGIIKEHCGKGFGSLLLNNTLKSFTDRYMTTLSEINVSTETDNYPALKMYRRQGFIEDYYYTQSYKPISK